LWGSSTVKSENEEVYILPLFSSSSLSSSNKGSPDTGDIADCGDVCSGRADEGEGECVGEGAGTKAGGAGGAGAGGGERGASKVIKTGVEEGNRGGGVSMKIGL
jgi:hypothetical protein